jgi:hypothetical protein
VLGNHDWWYDGPAVESGLVIAGVQVMENSRARIPREGGAFWIGRAGLAAALRAHDGRGGATALTDAAAMAFDGLDDLGDRLHGADRPVNRIAHFAPGEPIKLSGPLADFAANFVRLVERPDSMFARIEAEVQVMGRAVKIDVDPLDVRRA